MIIKETKQNLTDKDKKILEEMNKVMEERANIPDSEKVVLDSPKFTSFAIGMKDDGTFFTEEDTKRNNEILFDKYKK